MSDIMAGEGTLTPAQLAKIQSLQAQQAVSSGAPITKVKDATTPAPDLTPQEATALGLSASDAPVVPESLEKTGHVTPDTTDQPSSAPSPMAPIKMPIKQIPNVAKQAPTVKDIVTKIISGQSGPSGNPVATASEGDFWKQAAGKLGDFLQRWGMGLQGAPTGATQGDIARQQAFELQKQQMQAQVAAKQMALENQYQTQRMQLQQQMNQANMTAQGKIEIQNRITELDKEHQNALAMIGPEIEMQLRMRGFSSEAVPENQILSQGK